MAQFLGFGNSGDGSPTLSGTQAPIDSTAVTSGSNITATNTSFAQNQLVLIHQSQGTGVGGWEVNQIKNYVAGTVTPQIAQANTYGTGAQILVLPQYGTATISGSFGAKAWNGSTGGILGFIAQVTNNSGTLTADSCGFRGGAGSGSCNCGSNPSNCGEGSVGGSINGQRTANGNGGGGSDGTGADGAPGGGGGSNATQGGTAGSGQSSAPGLPGNTVGQSDCTVMIFGGGGGGGRGEKNGSGNGGNGGIGGGIIFIITGTMTNTGTITANGANGGSASFTNTDGAGGAGAGAGGIIFIKSNVGNYASGTLSVTGGSGGNSGCCAAGNGGFGGQGYIRLEQCQYTSGATMNGSVSTQTGGLAWCGVYSQMF